MCCLLLADHGCRCVATIEYAPGWSCVSQQHGHAFLKVELINRLPATCYIEEISGVVLSPDNVLYFHDGHSDSATWHLPKRDPSHKHAAGLEERFRIPANSQFTVGKREFVVSLRVAPEKLHLTAGDQAEISLNVQVRYLAPDTGSCTIHVRIKP